MRKRGLLIILLISIGILLSVGITQCIRIFPTNSLEITLTAAPTTGSAPLLVYFIGSVTHNDPTTVSFSWDFHDGTTSIQQNPVHRFEKPGEYHVTLTVLDSTSKTYNVQKIIIVQPPLNTPPTAQILTDRTQGNIPLSIQFTGVGTDIDGSIVHYFWDFGDETSSTEQNPNHIFEKTGTYTVSLSVTDNKGLIRTATILITAEESNNEFLPTSFVPWMVQTIGRIQINNHDLTDTGDMYDVMQSRAEKIQTSIDEALTKLQQFQLPASYDSLKQEFTTCLEAFKQFAYNMYKGAVAMLQKQYSEADEYFELALSYKNNAVDSILRISSIIE